MGGARPGCRGGRRTLLPGWLVRSIQHEQGRAGGEQRPAALTRGALRVEGGVRGEGARGGCGATTRRLHSGRRCRTRGCEGAGRNLVTLASWRDRRPIPFG